MLFNFQSKFKKHAHILILGLFVFTQVFGGLFLYTKPASAQMPVTEATLDQAAIQEQIDRVAAKRVEELQGTWWMGLVSAVMNAVGYFANKIAYDAAVAVASLGSGQTPAFFTQDWGSYLTDTALNSAGEFIGSISESYGDELGTAGLGNLCMPPDPQLRLNIGLSLGDSVAPNGPQPRCEWSNIVEQWDTFITEASTPEVLSRVSLQFRPGSGSGLGAWIQARGQMQDEMEKETKAATKSREEGGGFKSVGDLITKNIKTPSTVVKDSITKQIDPKSSSESDVEKAGSQASSAGALVGQNALSMLGSIASTFVNTLASKLMNRVMGGLFSLKDIGKLFPKGRGGLDNPEFAGLGGRAVAEATFADFLAPRIQEAGKYDPLVEMMTCPSGMNKAPENCVLDSQFAQAITQATMGDPLTIAEAIEKNLLRGDWSLISQNDPRHNDQYCFQKGYCQSNLVKLRKYRILPVGWEMAASLATDERTGATLKMVVDHFNNCNAEGIADVDHPWCHLIDPNWVLKVPAHQCKARVYGAVSIEGVRAETCVDAPSCIAEDDNGACESGWGYCTREKNIWRLPGDECDEQFDSCRALRVRSGEIKSYLMSTVDYGPPCTADDVGCKWYSTNQAKVGEEYKWQDGESGGIKSDRIYFNKNVAQCNEEGCSEFYKTNKETNLNLIANSSFEEAENVDIDPEKEAKYWTGDNQTFSPTAKDGGSSLVLGGSITQDISVGKPLIGRTFVLSLYARNAEGGTCTAGAGSRAVLEVNGVAVRTLNITETTNDRWGRKKTDGIYFGTGDPGANEENMTIEITGANCLIDAVQLEEASGVTDYHNGWAGLGDGLNLKKAPEYYSCYNYNDDGTVKTTDDAPQCSNFIGACQENEAGCEMYTPKDGDPPIPGITNFPNDYCPQECVGYQTFKQLETNFEEEKYPLFFIPKTAEQCSASQDGCDEFTSLETEAVENYSYLRQCQKPRAGDDSATYYTWEGSDTTGYQLKTWNLKRSSFDLASDADPEGGFGPCVGLVPGGFEADRVTRTCAFHDIVPVAGSDVGHAVGEGVCTKLNTIVGSLLYNPDCREFYDAEGRKHYRLYSKTIISTDDCHEYRKTYSTRDDCQNSGGIWNVERNDCKYDVYPAESKRCSSVGCRAYRGNAGANVKNIFQNNFEGGTEEWTGPAREVSQSSEAVDNGGHSLKITNARDVVASKSVAGKIRKDGIYLVSFWAKTEAAGGAASFQFNDGAARPTGRLVAPITQDLTLSWQQYTIGPIEVTWEPTPDNPRTADRVEGDNFTVTANGAIIYLDNILFKEVVDRIYLVKDSWNTPATCDMTAFGGSLPQAMLGCEEYRDRDRRQHFLKSFTSLCREEAVGCQKLVDTKNSQLPYGEVYNGVCRNAGAACDEVVGCPCSVNSARVCTVPRGQTSCRYNSVGIISNARNRAADTVEIKADSYAFLVVDKSKTCNPSNIGCEAFGAPKLDSNGSIICNLEADCAVEAGCECKRDGAKMCTVANGERTCTGEFDSVNFLNNPKLYEGQSKILCEASYDTCEEYLGSDGAKFYFREPGKRTCDWKESITYGGEKRSGWFRKDDAGADVPCYSDYTSAGVFGIWKNADRDYDKRVGNCLAAQNMCTKFVDPTSTSGENPEGEPYFYLKNDKLMERAGECNGQVSLQQGCVLFDDTSNLNKIYNANITYMMSEKGSSSVEPGGKVAPVDCAKTGECKVCTPDLGVPCDPDDPEAYCHTGPHYCFSEEDCPDDHSCAAGGINNANLIFKVRKDRICGEWLSCKSSTTTWDSFTNKKRELCGDLGLCGKVAEGSQAVTCGKWIDDDPENKTPQILDLKKYASRDTGWKGMDYSGYSIPNQFQTYKLSQVDLSDPGTTNSISRESEQRLGFVEEEKCFGREGDVRLGAAEARGTNRLTGRPCVERDESSNCYANNRNNCGDDDAGTCYLRDGTECRVVEGGKTVRKGKCWNKQCIYDPEGRPIDGFPKFAEYKPLEKESDFVPLCRAYPEKNSPFPRSVAYNETGESARKQGFSNAQICEEQNVCVGGDNAGGFCSPAHEGEDDPCGEGGICTKVNSPCDCSYSKITFGGTVKYFHKENDSIQNSICVGGSNAGVSCSLDDCPGPSPEEEGAPPVSPCACGWTGKASTGTCTAKDKVETVLGLKGYCLEKDKTTYINGSPEENACLTWYPIDQLKGSVDVYNQYVNAGYAPGDNGQMCLETELYVRPKPVWGCVEATGGVGYRTDGACEYETIYNDMDGSYERDDFYCQWRKSREGGCRSGEAAPETCKSCPTGWTYIEAGCSPTDDPNFCGRSGEWLDNCIYYCIPPGPLVNSKDTLEDTDDDDVSSDPESGPSVCFPDVLSRDVDWRSVGRGGYFEVKGAGDIYAIGGNEDSRKSPALYCEGKYYIKKSDYDAIVSGIDKEVEYLYPSSLGSRYDDWSGLLKAEPKMFPVCEKIVEVAESSVSSKAWTDRLYQHAKHKTCVDGECIVGSLRSGDRCATDSYCNSVKSSVEGSPDTFSLNYTYSSLLSPFGYVYKEWKGERTEVERPQGVPFCTNSIQIKMTETDLTCEDEEYRTVGLRIDGNPSARSYLNFSYQKRTRCDEDDDCNPGATIRCDIRCRIKCDGPDDCPGGTVCPDLAEGFDATMGDLMDEDEERECPEIAGDLIRYCVPDPDIDLPRGDRRDELEDLSTGPEGGFLCRSECERDRRGMVIGACSNTGDPCLSPIDCYPSLCMTDDRRGDADDPSLERWRTRVGLSWDEWASGESGFCAGISADMAPLEPTHEGGDYNRGETRIAELFAESFRIYKWSPKILPTLSYSGIGVAERGDIMGDGDKGFYENITPRADGTLRDNTFSTWNITESGDPITGETPTPPHVAPLKLPCVNDKCSPLTEGGTYVNGITVNDKNSGSLISRSGELAANIKFFAFADKNQMPLKRVCVDFGNGDTSPDCGTDAPVNFYKNHYGYKIDGSPLCDNTSDFAHAKQACTGDFFSYNTVYTCERDRGSMPACDATHTTNCFDTTCDDSSVTGGCCVFRPKVHVLDNWGWCNGSCPGNPGGAGSGCYDKSWDGLSQNECSIEDSTKNPWTPTNVKVIVVPR